MEKYTLFIAHSSDDEELVIYLKDQINIAFGGAIKVFAACDVKDVRLGRLWFEQIMQGIKTADTILVIANNDSVYRPWINFECGGAYLSGKKVIPICNDGMIPNALPEPMRFIQGIDMSQPIKVENLFSDLADSAQLKTPDSIDFDAIAKVFSIAETEKATEEEKPSVVGHEKIEKQLETWRHRPGAHQGEEIVLRVRLGAVRMPRVETTEKAGLDINTASRVTLHLKEDDYRPYIECLADRSAADIIEKLQPDTWGRARLKLKGTRISEVYGEKRLFAIIIIEEFIPELPQK